MQDESIGCLKTRPKFM